MSVMLTAVIDALEDREVAIVDVPGAFMQLDMDELVHVRFTGKMEGESPMRRLWTGDGGGVP